MSLGLGLGLWCYALPIPIGVIGYIYLRPDGASHFHRLDGISFFVRP